MKKLILPLSLVISVLSAKAQDIHFSQFENAPLQLNPALTGVNTDFRVILNYKDQWASIGTPYRTFAFSGELTAFKKRQKKAHMGLALSAFSDKAGDIEMGNRQIKATVSGIVNLDERNVLSAGIQGGYGQQSFSADKMKWQSQYNGQSFDPTLTGETVTANRFSYGDFSLGLNWNYGKDQMYISANNGVKFNAGFAMYHLNSPKQSFYNVTSEKLFSRYVFHGGSTFGFKNTNVQLLPSFMYLNQGPSTELTLGTYIKYILREDSKYTGFVKGAAISIGGFMRAKDSFIAAMMMEFGNYAIGASYDVNTSKLRAATNARGGFEISLRYRSPNPFLYQSKAQF